MLRLILLNHTKDRRFFLSGGLPVFMNGSGVPFLSYYMLVLLIDLHKQLRFAAGKDPARSFSDI